MENDETRQLPQAEDRITSAKGALEYLRGQQGKIGGFLKWSLIALAGVEVYQHIAQINDFMDGLVSLQEKLLYGGFLAGALYVLWHVLSSKQFQYTVTMILDRMILNLHHLAIARDKFGSAKFAINRLEKRKDEADEARSRVYAALQSVTKATQTAQGKMGEAFSRAKGFAAEMERRANNQRPQLQLSESGLSSAFQRSKSTLRINRDFFQKETEQAVVLQRRCSILQEVSEAVGVKIDEMKEELQTATSNWQLALDSMKAMQASDDIVGGPDESTYREALGGIEEQANLFNGRVQMLMDRLDPTVQQYRTAEAGKQIADEDAYQAFLSEAKPPAKVIKAEVVSSSPALPEGKQSSPLSEIDRMLGDGKKSPEAAQVSKAK